jgi:hypothetical protein
MTGTPCVRCNILRKAPYRSFTERLAEVS